jgi:hypothetical protein
MAVQKIQQRRVKLLRFFQIWPVTNVWKDVYLGVGPGLQRTIDLRHGEQAVLTPRSNSTGTFTSPILGSMNASSTGPRRSSVDRRAPL